MAWRIVWSNKSFLQDLEAEGLQVHKGIQKSHKDTWWLFPLELPTPHIDKHLSNFWQNNRHRFQVIITINAL